MGNKCCSRRHDPDRPLGEFSELYDDTKHLFGAYFNSNKALVYVRVAFLIRLTIWGFGLSYVVSRTSLGTKPIYTSFSYTIVTLYFIRLAEGQGVLCTKSFVAVIQT